MKLTPATIGRARPSTQKALMISVYKDSVVLGKNVCKLLDIPKNRVSFEFDQDRNALYVMQDAEGFPVSAKGCSFRISGRNLTSKFFELLKASQRINIEVITPPVAPGVYATRVTNKI